MHICIHRSKKIIDIVVKRRDNIVIYIKNYFYVIMDNTRGSSVASYLHEKQTSRIQSLYLYFNYFIKIVPFWLRNIRFLIQNTWSLFYGCHYLPLHRLMSLQRKLNVKIFLMFIVAENTGSVNIVSISTSTHVKGVFKIEPFGRF